MSEPEVKEGYGSDDSFFDDDAPTSSKLDDGNNYTDGNSQMVDDSNFEETTSYEKEDDLVEEVSSPPAEAMLMSCVMSTIEEESKSYETSGTAASVPKSGRVDPPGHVTSSSEDKQKSKGFRQSRELDVSKELRELEEIVGDTEIRTNIGNNSDLYHVSSPGDLCVSEDGIDAILRKMAALESAQNVIEQVLDSGVTDINDVGSIIAQIPLLDSDVLNEFEDPSLRSASEIASIQRLMYGDLSISRNSEVAGGNNLLYRTETDDQGTSNRERAVDDVLKEYEEFERSLSQASAIDDSFRSDISSLPSQSSRSNNLLLSRPNRPEEIKNGIPAIKPPVLKSVIIPSVATNSSVNISTNAIPIQFPMATTVPAKDGYYPPGSTHSSTSKNTTQLRDSSSSRSRTKPISSSLQDPKNISESRPVQAPKSTRLEGSQSSSVLKPNNQLQTTSFSARPATSATTTPIPTREYDQDAFKPRNRKMRSPRTMISPRQLPTDPFMDMPTGSSRGGAGEGYHIRQGIPTTDKTEYAVAEALKTIEKLNGMVARQETLLEAYSNDNQKLWTQLKESKIDSQEKEEKFQEVINSLHTEVATLKVNRLVSSSSSACHSPRQVAANKVELQRLRDDSDLKSQQLMELRKQILLLQSKLTEARSPMKASKFPVATSVISHEKEQDYQKSISSLNKQVRTLQKILYNKEQVASTQQNPKSQSNGSRSRPLPLQRTKSDLVKQNASNANQNQLNLIKNIRNIGVDASGIYPRRGGSFPTNTVNINTGNVLQASLSCLEKEREEFENIIEEKNRMIFEKETMILNLKEEVETLKGQLPEGEVVDYSLIDELRSRIITQNKVIQTLKEHLYTYKKLEADNVLLREDKSVLEQHVQDLKRKLGFAQSVGKPENEVLSLLSEKVDELNSRYYHRERQLDTLLNKLTLKTTTGGGGSSSNLSPRRLVLDQFSNNNGPRGAPLAPARSSALISADILHMADLSPSTSFNLFNTISDIPEM